MKSSVPIAISLTLLMLLLVLSAAFIFLFQSQMAYRDDIMVTEQALQQQQIQTEIERDAAYSTQTVAAEAFVTSEAVNIAMEAELVNSQQRENEISTQVAALETSIATAEFAIKQHEALAPNIHIVSPEDNSSFNVGDLVEIVVIASDVKGVTNVRIEVGTDIFEDTPEQPEQIILSEHTWSAVGDGPITMQVIAENEIGVSNPVPILLIIVAPTPTPTPTPTATPTATAEPPTATPAP